MPGSVRKVKIRTKSKRKTSRQKKVTLRAILKKREKKVRLYLLAGGFFLVFAAFYTSMKSKDNSAPAPSVITSLSSSFADEPVSVDRKFLEPTPETAKIKSPPVRIVISSLNIDLPVKESKIINGYWEVFPDSAGFGLGSAYPEENTGNQVIFAHARPGLFAPLKEIKQGDNITVFTKDSWYSYSVSVIKEVLPSQVEVIAPTADPVLTLYTCSGYADSKRLIVTARKN